MQIINERATKRPNNDVYVTWDYHTEGSYLNNENHFVVELSVSASSTGPFTLLKIQAYNQTTFTYTVQPFGFDNVFFKLRLLNIKTGGEVANKIVPIYKVDSKITKKLKNKKTILFSKKVKLDAWVYRRRSIGYRCRKCWSSIESVVIQDNCPVCFETGYGNDSVQGLTLLHMDGLFKLDKNGYLTFYKRNNTFNYYYYQTDEAQVKPGDEFRIETQDNRVVFTADVLAVGIDTLTLDYKQDLVINYVENCKFSVYRKQKTAIDGVHNTLAFLLSTPTSAFMNRDLTEHDSIKYGDTVFTVQDGVLTGDVGVLLEYNQQIHFIKNGMITNTEDVTGFFVVNTVDNKYYYVHKEIPTNAAYLYFYYKYDAQQFLKHNNKIQKLSTSPVPENLTAMFIVRSTAPTHVVCDLVTLSAYENAVLDDPAHIKFVFDHVFTAPARVSVASVAYCKALNQLEHFVNKNEVVHLPHTDIDKTVFNGCGVLLINLLTGVTYKGQTWSGAAYVPTADEPADFYVNPDTGELHLFDLPKAWYEIKYVYTVKDLVLKNTFTPVDPVFEDGLFKDADKWVFTHSSLRGKTLDISKLVVATGSGNEYQEFTIDKYYSDFGKLILSTKSGHAFWGALLPDTEISIDIKNTGGYYNRQETFVNFKQHNHKTEVLVPIGMKSDHAYQIELLDSVAAETGDLVYIPVYEEFFKLSDRQETAFRGVVITSTAVINGIPYSYAKLFQKLLDR